MVPTEQERNQKPPEKQPPSRFDYVAFDGLASQQSGSFKSMVTELETHINSSIHCGRSKALALTHLEETFMWIGKGIRNDQLSRSAEQN